MKILLSIKLALFFLLKTSLALAVNPIDIKLSSGHGLPSVTHIGDSYVFTYTFTNNLPFSELIHLTTNAVGLGFTFDTLCNKVLLKPKGQAGSSCTTSIEFNPVTTGEAKAELTLAYDSNVINISLSSMVKMCGNIVYPSNTGDVVPAPTLDSSQVWSFVSAPQLHPMKVSVSPYNPASLAQGIIFNSPYTSSAESTYGQSGSLIVDNDGNPIWFRPLSSPSLMNTDLKVQTLNGASVLTFWQGTLATPPAYTNLPPGGAEPGACYYILDNHYNVITTISAFNGFISDVHELLITPKNTALFFGTKVVPMDLTPYGGPENGSIHDYSIQEVDLATNELIFYWDAIEHIPLSSTHIPIASASQSSNVWDPYHLNSLGIMNDGSDNILFSSRNTWTIYRLNKITGKFVWQLSGDGSGDFSIPDTAAQFSWQHDARFLPGNKISMFDDACCTSYDYVPPDTTPSHGLILSLDLVNHKASLVSSYYHDPQLNSSSQGNTLSLSNGNIFVGYGGNGYYTEFSGAGNNESMPSVNSLYNTQMPGTNISYRSYRDIWVGTPNYPPVIVVKEVNNQTIVFASWNGSTETQGWLLYAGLSSVTLNLVASEMKNGFETAITSANNGPFFQVQAVDVNGQVIGTSAVMYAPS